SALSATATHDTKRGEDVRARLNVLSEIPGAWKSAVARWRTLNRRFKSDVRGALAPDANEEYLLYQTLVGAWPFDQDAAAFRDRGAWCARFLSRHRAVGSEPRRSRQPAAGRLRDAARGARRGAAQSVAGRAARRAERRPGEAFRDGPGARDARAAPERIPGRR